MNNLILLILITIFLLILLYITLEKPRYISTQVITPQVSSQVESVLQSLNSLHQAKGHRMGLSEIELANRAKIIDNNLNFINQTNIKQRELKIKDPTALVSFYSANHLIPYTYEEIIQLFTGLLIPENIRLEENITNIVDKDPSVEQESFLIDFDKIPSTEARYDIFYGLSPALFNKPRDQGTCGSCWAFSSTAVVEAQITKNNFLGNPINLSVQYYIDCVKRSYGCQGGFPVYVYQKIIEDRFVVFEEQRPYIQKQNEECKDASATTKFPVNINGIISFSEKDARYFPSSNIKGAENYRSVKLSSPDRVMIEKIKKILFTYGPLTVLVYVDKNLPFYSHGIHITKDTDETGKIIPPNHALVIAGYGVNVDKEDYWIIRNSWGPDWGEWGYFQLSTKSAISGLTIPLFDEFPPIITSSVDLKILEKQWLERWFKPKI